MKPIKMEIGGGGGGFSLREMSYASARDKICVLPSTKTKKVRMGSGSRDSTDDLIANDPCHGSFGLVPLCAWLFLGFPSQPYTSYSVSAL